jgi:hypothetical protein
VRRRQHGEDNAARKSIRKESLEEREQRARRATRVGGLSEGKSVRQVPKVALLPGNRVIEGQGLESLDCPSCINAMPFFQLRKS